MKIISRDERTGTNTVTALGIFDGVHLGHRRVLGAACERAKALHAGAAVFTFDTMTVTSKGRLDALLTDEDKLMRLEEAGIDYVYDADFSKLRELSAEEFIDRVLVGKMHAVCAVCGEDFRFGKGGAADSAELRRLCAERGIDTVTVKQLSIGGETVSSTRIRELIQAGEIAHANALLGYRWRLTAEVIHGAQLGRTWDFPTINQTFPEGLALPRFGVYCSKVTIGGKSYAGVTNIGVKPTVGKGSPPLAETFIIDYSGDLYGQTLSTELYEFVRPEKRFASFAELKEEIGRNTEFTKEYFSI
ncbi:MAG: riboflavin biosynthesis protein RibF [Ruminococcus sp.]|nr:riboflavin biosynthesis protein RibF [Ruminococcus sp.]